MSRLHDSLMLALALNGVAIDGAWAQASTGPKIVLLVEASTDPLASRIREELATMGFDAVIEEREVGSVDELEAVASDGQAAAAARVEMLESGVRVWLFDRATGKTLTRELPRKAQGEEASLALHAVELLRASLLELLLPDAPRGDLPPTHALLDATGVPPAPAKPVASAAPPPARPAHASASEPPAQPSVPIIAAELGAALVNGSGDFYPYPALLVAVQYFVTSEFRLGPVGWIPLARTNHVAAVGTSENRITLFGVEARWQPSSGAWRPFVGLGVGAAYLQTQGHSNQFQGVTDHATTPGALLRGGVGLRLTRSFRLSPQATLGLQSRYFSIDYADGSSAHWGPWWGAVSLTLEGDFTE